MNKGVARIGAGLFALLAAGAGTTPVLAQQTTIERNTVQKWGTQS